MLINLKRQKPILNFLVINTQAASAAESITSGTSIKRSQIVSVEIGLIFFIPYGVNRSCLSN
jgi:hypothetical protein